MIEARNPFNLRKVENIGSDDAFLSLFQPTTIETLDPDLIWDRLHLFRSSQGGGKSSLLKLFTPGPLWRLWRERNVSKAGREWNELYDALNRLSVFGEDGPIVVGVITPCTRSYDALEHLPTTKEHRARLLNTLFDVRAITEAMKAALAVRGLRFPEHAHRLSFSSELKDEYAGDIPFGSSAEHVFDWARRAEHAVWRAVDAGEEPPSDVGHATLHSLHALRPGALLVDGRSVSDRCLLMYDDVHQLGQRQRSYLLKTAIESRPRAAVWVAERLQVLDVYELISLGASSNRESVSENLANQWKLAAQRRPKVFHVIGTKRMAQSSVNLDTDFEGIVSATLDQGEFLERLQDAYTTLRQEVDPHIKKKELFRDLPVTNATADRIYEAAVQLKETQIVIARNIQKRQRTFDMPEAIDMPSADESRPLHMSAEYQLCHRFKLPYYFGLDKVAQLSSANVDQFLRIGGAIFEEVLSLKARNKRPPVPARRQEILVQRAAEQMWLEIPIRMPQGRLIQQFLSALGEYGRSISLHPKASYGALTGFALEFEDHKRLAGADVGKNTDEALVANVLALCVAHNLLTMEPNAKQGAKNRTLTKFYLNRLLCVREQLPLAYGGFHVQSISVLADWVRTGRGSAPVEAALDLAEVEEIEP